MLEFLEAHWQQIVTMTTAVAGAVASAVAVIRTFQTNKKLKKNEEKQVEETQITREGIVEAFKQAKIPSEWKISVSNQVNTILKDFTEEIVKLIKSNQAISNDALVLVLTILSNTAASNKLTDEEKNRVKDVIALITEADRTIEI